MDVDRTQPGILQKYRVRGTPTFALFDKNGKLVQTFPGWPGKTTVSQWLDRLLSQS